MSLWLSQVGPGAGHSSATWSGLVRGQGVGEGSRKLAKACWRERLSPGKGFAWVTRQALAPRSRVWAEFLKRRKNWQVG